MAAMSLEQQRHRAGNPDRAAADLDPPPFERLPVGIEEQVLSRLEGRLLAPVNGMHPLAPRIEEHQKGAAAEPR